MIREYILLNRAEPVLCFSCERNAFDEPEFSEREWLAEIRPIGYGNLTDFLARRQAPKHRRHIKELLEHYGCDDLEGFLRVSHALSLNDTFWVKEADSDLEWQQVSLYRNEFDRLVSEAAFDGIISETDLSSTSPEFGTDGYYAKCWIRDEDGIWLYKSGSGLHVIEPVSEYLVSQLAQRICPNTVFYDLEVYHDKLVSKCALFTSEETGLAKAGNVFRGEQTIPYLLEGCRLNFGEDDFRRMCVLDALTLNPDRHYGNFGFLFDNRLPHRVGTSNTAARSWGGISSSLRAVCLRRRYARIWRHCAISDLQTIPGFRSAKKDWSCSVTSYNLRGNESWNKGSI